MIEWHRLFGMTLTDFFTGSSYMVELEKDLSLKQQLLDVVIIEKKEGKPPQELPDGFDNLAAHNLISYKSFQESLDEWTLDELLGHYVNYRKQISLSLNNLLPDKDFRLYAVSTRFPENLAKNVKFGFLIDGVYDILWGSRPIRIIVLSRISEEQRNAIWLLFSGIPDKVRYGASRYRRGEKSVISRLMNKLFAKYKTEGVVMPYTKEDFMRETTEEILNSLTLDQMLKRFSLNEVLKQFSADEVLKQFSADEVLKHLSHEQIKSYLRKTGKKHTKRTKKSSSSMRQEG